MLLRQTTAQQSFFFMDTPTPTDFDTEETPDLASYDHVLVAFSGGKDSLACVLHLLDQGADPTKIELWHHDIDGREGGPRLMDWPCTPSYCEAVGKALGLPVFFSWRRGGFLGEMLRQNTPTAAVTFQSPDGEITTGGKSKDLGTRLRFPQVAADLQTRWCSAYLKIMVGIAAITNQDRFLKKRVLFVTGERAEESSGRAKYATLEPHKTDTRTGPRRRRHVDHWRPVHAWTEQQVWDIISRHRINAHPCYRLGWSRASCAGCIFQGDDHWASLQAVLPGQLDLIADKEEEFGVTIARDRRPIRQRCGAGRAFPMDAAVMAEARDENWTGPVILPPGTWTMPIGAFRSPASGPC